MGEGSDGFWKETETPDRSTRNCQNEAASLRVFEDSPIFSFINSLSPIKPLKSAHISQMINPLSFTSLPSVFTSPQANPLRESPLTRGHQLSDPSKPEFSSGDANEEIVDGPKNSAQQKEILEPEAPECEMAGELANGSSKLVDEFVGDTPYPFSSPCSCVETKNVVAESSWKSSSIVAFAEEASQRNLFTSEGNLEGVNQVSSNKGIVPCDSGRLIPDTADIFESQNGMEFDKKSVDPATSFYSRIKDAVQNMHSTDAVVSGDQIGLPAQLGEEIENMETAANVTNSSEMQDFEQFSGLYRGIRRRCLVFEMKGGNYGNQLEENSSSDSSLLLQSDGSTSSSQQLQLSQCALPAVGLHLNPLAKTPTGYKIANHEALGSGRLLIGCSLSANFPPQTFNQELFGNSLVHSLERQIDTFENGVLPVEDPCRESALMPDAEIIQSCQKKKKRRRMEPAREGESCKRCNCKKSRCLKLYCECFAAGVYCVEPCACIDCFNKPIHKDTVLATRKQIESRNPLAFAPKVIRGSDSISEAMDNFSKTPASARHKRGCNCKKSGCLKKYCECYQGGVGCSINCRCEGCKNTFGRKNGSGMLGMDTESEEEETETTQKPAMDRSTEKPKILGNMEQNTDSEPPATPSRSGSLPSSQGLLASSFFPPVPKLDNQLETVREDETMPQFLQGVLSPIDSIKLSSPNRKRVSPPQQQLSTSPGFGRSKRLLFESIPPFPSLSSNQ